MERNHTPGVRRATAPVVTMVGSSSSVAAGGASGPRDELILEEGPPIAGRKAE